jgi:hypothetical protein
MPESAWVPAITQAGEEREGASVCELTNLDLKGWPEGTRAICRREGPHPGAQLTFSDHQGFRFQAFITDQDDADLAQLEARHLRTALQAVMGPKGGRDQGSPDGDRLQESVTMAEA